MGIQDNLTNAGMTGLNMIIGRWLNRPARQRLESQLPTTNPPKRFPVPPPGGV